MSCMVCKVKGKTSNICKFKDALAPILEEFPWLSYNDYSMTATKRMPVVLIETMNGTPERNNDNGYGSMEYCLASALGQPEHIIAYNTCQVKDYARFELAGFSEDAKRRWREEHWEKDLQKAFDAGRKMAESILR